MMKQIFAEYQKRNCRTFKKLAEFFKEFAEIFAILQKFAEIVNANECAAVTPAAAAPLKPLADCPKMT